MAPRTATPATSQRNTFSVDAAAIAIAFALALVVRLVVTH